MSSLFSDPPFRRGVTLLDGELIELLQGPTQSYNQSNVTATPIAGPEIVGQVKVFPDVHPVTGVKLSNELVYCVAARYKPATATSLNATAGADSGKAVVMRLSTTAGSMCEFTGTFATADDVLVGRRVGFIDEYLNSEIRPNDIVWVTIKGPAAVRKTTSAAVNANLPISLQGDNVDTGRIVTMTNIVTVTTDDAQRVAMGQSIGSLNTTTNVVTFGANAAQADEFARVILFGRNWAD